MVLAGTPAPSIAKANIAPLRIPPLPLISISPSRVDFVRVGRIVGRIRLKDDEHAADSEISSSASQLGRPGCSDRFLYATIPEHREARLGRVSRPRIAQ